MEQKTIKFEFVENRVFVYGYPELEGRRGVTGEEGMAFFFGKESGDYDFYVANTTTGKIRKLSTKQGTLLVDDSEIDYDAIAKECYNGINNARMKAVRYNGMNRWSNFKEGICAITWTLYPDGRYFADGDGYGMEDCYEEVACAIIDHNLDIIEPFRPIEDITAYLQKLRDSRLQ
ncbi:MAG: hypothetical protein IJC92_04530 [Bacteroidaceae bacterium]|nr:hypothetical protein [Bacteroidaceae bacterium]